MWFWYNNAVNSFKKIKIQSSLHSLLLFTSTALMRWLREISYSSAKGDRENCSGTRCAALNTRSGGSPGGVRGQGGLVPAELRRTLGSLTKQSKLVSFNSDLVLSVTICCTHMNPAEPSELRRTLGFLTKKPCILLEDRMRPQPFVSLGTASKLLFEADLHSTSK